MIVYNVTCHVDESILTDWVQWMQEVHLPEVMATDKFVSYRFLKVDPLDASDDGNSYAIQYLLKSREHYRSYAEEHGPTLKQKTLERYGDKITAFRTTLELISESE